MRLWTHYPLAIICYPLPLPTNPLLSTPYPLPPSYNLFPLPPSYNLLPLPPSPTHYPLL